METDRDSVEQRPTEGSARFGRFGVRFGAASRPGDVVLQLKSPYNDGTTHIVMSPLEFMQRLAALVPRPRLHLIRFHGVLAPNAKHRSAIVPSAPVSATNAAEVHPNTAHHSAPTRISWARLLKRTA